VTILDVFPALGSLVEKLIPDPNKKAEIMLELSKIEAQTAQATLGAQKEIIVAEAQGSWLQRNWRPLLMLEVVFIVGFNFVVVPVLAVFGLTVQTVPLPEQLWVLMNIGVGGYVIGRSGEKMAPSVAQVVTQAKSPPAPAPAPTPQPSRGRRDP
jgi:cytochrome c biogenesis protein CcdA